MNKMNKIYIQCPVCNKRTATRKEKVNGCDVFFPRRHNKWYSRYHHFGEKELCPGSYYEVKFDEVKLDERKTHNSVD